MLNAAAATDTENERGSNEASPQQQGLQNARLALTLQWGFYEGSARGRWPLGPHP
jgi:hypothetical protein